MVSGDDSARTSRHGVGPRRPWRQSLALLAMLTAGLTGPPALLPAQAAAASAIPDVPGLEAVGSPQQACLHPTPGSQEEVFDTPGFDTAGTALLFTCGNRFGRLVVDGARMSLVTIPRVSTPTIMASTPDLSRLVIEEPDGESPARIYGPTGVLLSGAETIEGRRRQAFSPDGRFLAVHGGDVLEIRDGVGRVLSRSPYWSPGQKPVDGWTTALTIAPDSRSLLIAHSSEAVQLWGLDGRLRRTVALPRSSEASDDSEVEDSTPVSFLSFLPDGRSFVAVGRDGTVGHWSTDGTLIRSFQVPSVTESPQAVAMAADGTLLITPQDEPLSLWSLEGRKLRELSDPQGGGWVQYVRFSADGRSLQVETLDELQLWSRDGAILRRIPTDLGARLSGLSLDGRSLVTVINGPEVMVRLWRLQPSAAMR